MMILLRYLLLILLIAVFNMESIAQGGGIKGLIKRRQALKEKRIEAGQSFLSPMIGPGYTPDAGLLFAFGGLLTFKTNPEDSLIQSSSLPVTLVVTTRGNITFGGLLKSFWWQDRFRFNINLRLSDANDDYFGIGYQAAVEVPQSDTTSAYNRRGWKVSPEFLFRLNTNFYSGLILDFNNTQVRETNPVMETDPSFTAFGPDNYNTGLGLTLRYDSRDIVVNAWKGFYAEITSTFYESFLGGDNTYQILLTDFRHYRGLDREGNTIAFRFKGRFGFGDVPYEEMTKIGGSRDLRGYIKGQYRDKNGVQLLAEYRHTFLDADHSLSPHGFTAWIGTGAIYDKLDDLERWLPNLGVGYRFEIQPRMNVRIDLGIGRDTSGLYFGFTEAF